MSLRGKRWRHHHRTIPTDVQATLLSNRGIPTEETELFFEGTYAEHGYSPYLMEDMEKAIQRIITAITAQERIVVSGDYDVDGTTGTTVLVKGLEACGALVSYRIPHRLIDGYGLKKHFVDELKEKEVGLILTVDNGISALAEITYANTLGIDVIITDHHEAPATLPPAVAILNPRLPGCAYPNKHLSGSMVGYKLIEALTATLLDPEVRTPLLEELLAIGSIGLVADCMPLHGENRLITKAGLELLRRTTHPGLKELFVQADIKQSQITSGTIGFQIGPRINASGRMESAYNALHLLLKDEQVARIKAPLLERLNYDRRNAVKAGVTEAMEMVGYHPVDHMIIVASPQWNPGINGLIASGLLERFARPVLVLSEKEGMLTGSARSIEGFNVIEAITKCKEHLAHFGGHPQAAGLSLPAANYSAFRKALLKHANTTLHPEDLKHTLTIDCPLTPAMLTKDTLAVLEQFAPFGIGNPTPCFSLQRITTYEAEAIGKTHAHLKLHVKTPQGIIPAIGFSLGEYAPQLRHKPPISIAFELQEHTWNQRTTLQLMVKDIEIHN